MEASEPSPLSALEAHGFIILRECFDPYRVLELRSRVDRLYRRFNVLHIEPRELRAAGEAPLHESLFEERHYGLLAELFPAGWKVSESTSTRRIGPRDATHQRPLAPHIDAFFHDMAFTVNFWTPLQPCGNRLFPSLTVWDLPIQAVRELTEFSESGRQEAEPWNFRHFPPRWFELCQAGEQASWLTEQELGHVSQLEEGWFSREFGPGETPRMALGDAILLTNWTLHATGSGTPCKTRSNVELRFSAVVPDVWGA